MRKEVRYEGCVRGQGGLARSQTESSRAPGGSQRPTASRQLAPNANTATEISRPRVIFKPGLKFGETTVSKRARMGSVRHELPR